MRKISTLCLCLFAFNMLSAQTEETLEVITHTVEEGQTTVVTETIDENYDEYDADDLQKKRRWALGLHLGLDQNGTDTHSWGRHGEGIFNHAHFAYGLHAKYSFGPRLAVRGDYFGSKMTGNDLDNDGPCSDGEDEDQPIGCHRDRGWSFSSPLHELSASVEWDILGKRRYPEIEYFNADGQKLKSESVRLGYGTYYDEDGEVIHFNEVKRFKRKLSPYVGIGIAGTYVKPDVNFDPEGTGYPSLAAQRADSLEQKNWYLHIPVSVGLRYDLSEQWYLDGELRGVFESTDLLDGMKTVANFDDFRNHHDVYQFATLRIGYRMGVKKDRDGDGVSDKQDVCPDVFGVKDLKGCPDRDRDGISDEVDACPDIKGLRRFAGCPDTDEDGVQDLLDLCPEIKGSVETKGCPDSDLDGIVDNEDYCPNKFGLAELDGCPDRDGDGVPDHRDACPDVKGEDAYHGCNEGYPSLSEEYRTKYNIPEREEVIETPEPETKIIRREIKTDNNSSTRVIRNEVENSSTKVIRKEVDNSSSNVVRRETTSNVKRIFSDDEEREVKRVFNNALEGIKFNSSRWTFKQESYAPMDNVLRIMKQYPDMRVGINGHTDSSGDNGANQVLSQNRANAVRDYLVKNGIESHRLVATGFGENQPIADNATSQGRYQNRRVEFVLLDQ